MRCRLDFFDALLILLILFAGVVFYRYNHPNEVQKVEEIDENLKPMMSLNHYFCGFEIDTKVYWPYCTGWSCTLKQCFDVKSCFKYPDVYSKKFPVDEFANLVEENKKFIEELFTPGSRFLNQTKIELLKQMEQYGFNVKVKTAKDVFINVYSNRGVEVLAKVCPN